MIHHLSISAENPQHVAQVLAEILQGQATPHPFSPDDHIVFPLLMNMVQKLKFILW
ncbi:hypothetical protein [Nostoc flagelliforme]|uniref:hypothetical protein n=1 Tax=Nostoc flagelliforme TaxID=1306274 RepID=UPI0030CC25A5